MSQEVHYINGGFYRFSPINAIVICHNRKIYVYNPEDNTIEPDATDTRDVFFFESKELAKFIIGLYA
jgi:hypothetical protein